MNNPQQQVIDILFGRWHSQIFYAGVRLGSSMPLVPELRRRMRSRPSFGASRSLTYRLLGTPGDLVACPRRPGASERGSRPLVLAHGLR
jgi:hypothetical protein